MFKTDISASVGGQFNENVHKWFQRGISVGDSRQVVIGRDGAMAIDAEISAKDITISDSASSTLQVGSAASSNNSGCLAMGASNATGTLMYLTIASNGTVTASSTKPATCK